MIKCIVFVLLKMDTPSTPTLKLSKGQKKRQAQKRKKEVAKKGDIDWGMLQFAKEIPKEQPSTEEKPSVTKKQQLQALLQEKKNRLRASRFSGTLEEKAHKAEKDWEDLLTQSFSNLTAQQCDAHIEHAKQHYGYHAAKKMREIKMRKFPTADADAATKLSA